MAREGESSVKAETAPEPDDPRKPQSPTDLKTPSVKHALKNAFAEFNRDQATDLAAALTYYAVLSMFPAMLALISVLGVFGEGQATADAILQLLKDIGQGDAAQELEGPITNLANAEFAGFGLVTGLGGALWAAANYVNAFGRAMNRVYQVDEGRPFWKLRPQMLLVTVITLTLAALILVGVALSGDLAKTIGEAVGLGDQTVMVWNIAKWPVILFLVVLAVAILYYATPNIQQPKFRWMSLGAFVAILVWIVASVGFGFYVSNFGKYNATYGSLAGVIVFLLWLWLTNLALLFGAEVDAEVERARQLQAGIEAEETLQLPPRDTRNSEKAAETLQSRIDEGREIRLHARAHGATGHKAAAAGTDDKPAGSTPVDHNSHKVGQSADPDESSAPSALEPLPSEVARERGY